jgi:hypothetical protein
MPNKNWLEKYFFQASARSPAYAGLFCKKAFFAVLNVTVKNRALFLLSSASANFEKN